MDVKFVYAFYVNAFKEPRATFELDQSLCVQNGDTLRMDELGRQPVRVDRVEHHLTQQAGEVVCKTSIHCR
jgi:hypothetical protein